MITFREHNLARELKIACEKYIKLCEMYNINPDFMLNESKNENFLYTLQEFFGFGRKKRSQQFQPVSEPVPPPPSEPPQQNVQMQSPLPQQNVQMQSPLPQQNMQMQSPLQQQNTQMQSQPQMPPSQQGITKFGDQSKLAKAIIDLTKSKTPNLIDYVKSKFLQQYKNVANDPNNKEKIENFFISFTKALNNSIDKIISSLSTNIDGQRVKMNNNLYQSAYQNSNTQIS